MQLEEKEYALGYFVMHSHHKVVLFNILSYCCGNFSNICCKVNSFTQSVFIFLIFFSIQILYICFFRYISKSDGLYLPISFVFMKYNI